MIEIINLSSGSKGNCYIVKNKNTKILLECGLNKDVILDKLNANKIKLNEMNGCLVSHQHSDHSLSIKYISDFLKIYANYDTLNKYNIFKNNVIINHKDTFRLGTIDIATYSITHGETPCNCFIFKDKDSLILFATDFMKIEQDLSIFEFTNIYIECNYNQYIIDNLISEEKNKYLRQINTHCSLENLIIHLDRMNLSKCNEIVLIHYSKDVCNIENCVDRIESEFGIPVYYAKQEGGIV